MYCHFTTSVRISHKSTATLCICVRVSLAQWASLKAWWRAVWAVRHADRRLANLHWPSSRRAPSVQHTYCTYTEEISACCTNLHNKQLCSQAKKTSTLCFWIYFSFLNRFVDGNSVSLEWIWLLIRFNQASVVNIAGYMQEQERLCSGDVNVNRLNGTFQSHF